MFPLLAQAAVEVQTVTNPSHDQGTYVLGWGTLSLINAGLAQSKNRSGLTWWLISLLLGPIATLILVAFMDKVEVPTGKPRAVDPLS